MSISEQVNRVATKDIWDGTHDIRWNTWYATRLLFHSNIAMPTYYWLCSNVLVLAVSLCHIRTWNLTRLVLPKICEGYLKCLSIRKQGYSVAYRADPLPCHLPHRLKLRIMMFLGMFQGRHLMNVAVSLWPIPGLSVWTASTWYLIVES